MATKKIARQNNSQQEQASYAKGTGKIDFRIFIPSFLIILAITIPLTINPSLGREMVNQSRYFVTTYFGWIFMVVPVVCLGLIIWLSFGRYGNIVLGDADEKPEFSYFSWVSMLFCCGVGSSIIVWGVCEPIYYLQTPPLGIAKGSLESFAMAQALPQFHWGLSAWAIYAVASLGMAYSLYIRKNQNLRLSSACEGLLGKKRTQGAGGVVLEVLVVLGSVGGFGTSLGLGVPFVAEFFSYMFGVENTLGLKVFVVLLWTGIFTMSVFRGLAKGMQYLSALNIWLVMAIFCFILVVGPTLFIFDSWINSLGVLFNNFFSLSFSTEPYNVTAQGIRQAGFPQSWTIFYWAWWIALAPITGIFLGRISRGRSIRSVLLGITFWGSLGCSITLAILSGYTIHLEYFEILNVSEILKENNYNAGITAAKVLLTLPAAKIMVPFYCLLALIFLATTLDAAAFSLASICTKNLSGREQPARYHRLIWALTMGLFSVGLLITGGEESLATIQTSATVAGAPLLIALTVMIAALIYNLKNNKNFNLKNNLKNNKEK